MVAPHPFDTLILAGDDTDGCRMLKYDSLAAFESISKDPKHSERLLIQSVEIHKANVIHSFVILLVRDAAYEATPRPRLYRIKIDKYSSSRKAAVPSAQIGRGYKMSQLTFALSAGYQWLESDAAFRVTLVDEIEGSCRRMLDAGRFKVLDRPSEMVMALLHSELDFRFDGSAFHDLVSLIKSTQIILLLLIPPNSPKQITIDRYIAELRPSLIMPYHPIISGCAGVGATMLASSHYLCPDVQTVWSTSWPAISRWATLLAQRFNETRRIRRRGERWLEIVKIPFKAWRRYWAGLEYLRGVDAQERAVLGYDADDRTSV